MGKRRASRGDVRIDAAIAVLLALAASLIYAAFAARDLMFGDGGELTLAAATNGVAHPPGYPLWIVIGHLFTLLPAGTIPYRASLSASVFHGCTIGLVYLSAFSLTKRRMASLAAAVLLAISPLFVTWSLQPEVFSLNDLIVAAIVLLSLLWLEDAKKYGLAIPIAALFGLGLANQQTVLLLAPLALWSAWCGRRELFASPRAATIAVVSCGLFVVGWLVPYAHTYLASQRPLAWGFGQARTPRELIDLIDRRAYGTTSLVVDVLRGGSPATRLFVLIGALGFCGVASAAGAIAMLVTRRTRLAIAAALIFAGTAVVFCAIANIDASFDYAHILFLRFALMPLVALAPFSACAFDALDRFVALPRFREAISGAVLATLVLVGVATIPQESLASLHDARTLARDEFNALPQRAVVFAKGDTLSTILPYFQIVERWRPDVLVIYPDLLAGDWYVRDLQSRITVPSVASRPPTIFEIVAANPRRDFYGIGDPDVQGEMNNGGPYVAYTRGLASWIVPRGTFVPLRPWFVQEVQLQSESGYAALVAHDERYNGFTTNARSYYANGFLNAGLDAERLKDNAAARRWFERAAVEQPSSPVIIQALARVCPVGDPTCLPNGAVARDAAHE
jgi:hypothetical protein